PRKPPSGETAAEPQVRKTKSRGKRAAASRNEATASARAGDLVRLPACLSRRNDVSRSRLSADRNQSVRPNTGSPRAERFGTGNLSIGNKAVISPLFTSGS